MADLDELRQLALRAAEAAGEVIRRRFDEGAVATEEKGRGDYVTATDRAAEEAAIAVLRQGAPGVPVVAEESGGQGGDRFWAVDPLDGTTNFVRAFPVVGVSVALLEDGRPAAGAVVAPLLGDAWCAARGGGAWDRRGRRLSVGGVPGRGVVATGFPFRRPDNRARYLPVLEGALAEFEDLRRAGAASLDLAFAATGSFDGFFELGLALWDIAAGALLVTEAGGVVTDWTGDAEAVFRSGDILAGAPRWHERMLDVVGTAAGRDAASG